MRITPRENQLVNEEWCGVAKVENEGVSQRDRLLEVSGVLSKPVVRHAALDEKAVSGIGTVIVEHVLCFFTHMHTFRWSGMVQFSLQTV